MRLRSEILKQFPDKQSDKIFHSIKKRGSAEIEFSDLQKLCEGADVSPVFLNQIFRPYAVVGDKLSLNQFDEFLRSGELVEQIPDGLTWSQLQILRNMAKTIRGRRTQGIPSKYNRSPEIFSVAQSWVYVCRTSPDGIIGGRIMLAALCRLANRNWNLRVGSEELIDALRCFLGKACEAIDFYQFCSILQTF
jgi:hypothetical protein